jgi:hypothetical protein
LGFIRFSGQLEEKVNKFDRHFKRRRWVIADFQATNDYINGRYAVPSEQSPDLSVASPFSSGVTE